MPLFPCFCKHEFSFGLLLLCCLFFFVFHVQTAQAAPGDLKWKVDIGANINSSPAISNNVIIYVGSEDNRLYAFDSQGNQEWNATTQGDIQSSPAINEDGIIYVGSNDNKLTAFCSGGSPCPLPQKPRTTPVKAYVPPHAPGGQTPHLRGILA